MNDQTSFSLDLPWNTNTYRPDSCDWDIAFIGGVEDASRDPIDNRLGTAFGFGA